MSRLARAIEILEAINEHFQADAVELYADAQILEGDTSIKDAISDCLGRERREPIIPHSKRRRVSYNQYTGWSGWLGKRKVEKFLNAETAQQWLHEEREEN
jgi:hypothetical protein